MSTDHHIDHSHQNNSHQQQQHHRPHHDYRSSDDEVEHIVQHPHNKKRQAVTAAAAAASASSPSSRCLVVNYSGSGNSSTTSQNSSNNNRRPSSPPLDEDSIDDISDEDISDSPHRLRSSPNDHAHSAAVIHNHMLQQQRSTILNHTSHSHALHQHEYHPHILSNHSSSSSSNGSISGNSSSNNGNHSVVQSASSSVVHHPAAGSHVITCSSNSSSLHRSGENVIFMPKTENGHQEPQLHQSQQLTYRVVQLNDHQTHAVPHQMNNNPAHQQQHGHSHHHHLHQQPHHSDASIPNHQAPGLSLSGSPAAAAAAAALLTAASSSSMPAHGFHPLASGGETAGSSGSGSPAAGAGGNGYFIMMGGSGGGGRSGSPDQIPVHGAPAPRKKSNSINVADLSVANTSGRNSRDERRRATHNEVERRRRDKINNWITKLAKLVPDCNQDHTKQGQSKGGILAKTCDHINELEQRVSQYRELAKDREILASEVLALRDQLNSASCEIRRLRGLLAKQGIQQQSSHEEDLS